MEAKLDRFILPIVAIKAADLGEGGAWLYEPHDWNCTEYQSAPLGEAVAELERLVIELDRTRSDPPLYFEVEESETAPEVRLFLVDAPLRQALDLLAAQTGYIVELAPPSRVLLKPLPPDPPGCALITKVIREPRWFFAQSKPGIPSYDSAIEILLHAHKYDKSNPDLHSSVGKIDPFLGDPSPPNTWLPTDLATRRILYSGARFIFNKRRELTLDLSTEPAPDRRDLTRYFAALGVEFPEGASAAFDIRERALVTTHTPRAIRQIEALLVASRRADPKPVTTALRFAEISARCYAALGNPPDSIIEEPQLSAFRQIIDAHQDPLGDAAQPLTAKPSETACFGLRELVEYISRGSPCMSEKGAEEERRLKDQRESQSRSNVGTIDLFSSPEMLMTKTPNCGTCHAQSERAWRTPHNDVYPQSSDPEINKVIGQAFLMASGFFEAKAAEENRLLSSLEVKGSDRFAFINFAILGTTLYVTPMLEGESIRLKGRAKLSGHLDDSGQRPLYDDIDFDAPLAPGQTLLVVADLPNGKKALVMLTPSLLANDDAE